MGSQKRPIFDLNEAPPDFSEGIHDSPSTQPQQILPSVATSSSDKSATYAGPESIPINNTHPQISPVSGFQPFVKTMSFENTDDQKKARSGNSDFPLPPKLSYETQKKVSSTHCLANVNDGSLEKGEREQSDGQPSASMPENDSRHIIQSSKSGTALQGQEMVGVVNMKTLPVGTDAAMHDLRDAGRDNSSSNSGDNKSADGKKYPESISTGNDVKGIEASHAMKSANNLGKKHKLDEQKKAMLGKKRNRQTMFLNLEDVKQVGAVKSSTPRKTIQPPSGRITKGTRNGPSSEHNEEKQNDAHQVGLDCKDELNTVEPADHNPECNGESKRLNSSGDQSVEGNSLARQNSLSHPADLQQPKSLPVSFKKPSSSGRGSLEPKLGRKNPPKKQIGSGTQYQDTSVERLLREVTSDRIWRNPVDSELQSVPGQFESVEEYVGVFEPLLFVECRAQLYSTWEELTEPTSKEVHVTVRVKCVERRERGWYDVIVLPVVNTKWTFKEGDVAVLSSSRPGSVRLRRTGNASNDDLDDPNASMRVAGTVRRHIPIDTRGPMGAILHFYVGDSYDPNSVDNDHILRKLQPKDIWFLTVLGSLATTQREYVALHAFRHLNQQMQGAILEPSPEHFPKYDEQAPAVPECITPCFVEHLNRSFNGPQLAAIQWAATHTAAGTSNGMAKKQDPWPFTLVQGPPGTGKTHTVWGMLNVIHLVQYQHYYTALLKKLAPDSYKQANENNGSNVASGSIDEVLLSMDQNLFRTLPKLCPKPRMLVCAPSNAATDELLARVLDRGFIDGEMKVYKPDVARVGVDTQSRAAQAVSVERRTEYLLMKSREEIYGWLQSLKGREAHLSQQIAFLQRQLVATAAAGRSQGSVGVDPDLLMARDQNRDALLQNLAAVVEGRDKVLVEMSRLLIIEGKFRPGSGFNLEEARASLEASFANEAEIVFTTVSSSGRKLFQRLTHGFDMVVIDEAAQASEVGVLPALSLGAARCVLVGDPQQLPATVISKEAGTLLYSRSLFQRLQQAGCPSLLLSVQYRMHPQIRDFPSRHFYKGLLTDSESVTKLPDEKYYQDPLLRPYVFYDVTQGRESHRGGSASYQNIQEAQFVLRLYEHLQKTVKSLGLRKVSVGIITPYKLQLKCLQQVFGEVLNSEEGRDLYINTVDAFQGQERDVIIMSCVRASGHGVGFVADIRRMNVALTRARRALWVTGNSNSLVQSDDWAALIADAKARNCYMDMGSLPKEFQAPKIPSYTPFPNRIPHGAWGPRPAGPRTPPPGFAGMPMEPKLGPPTQMENPNAPPGRSESHQTPMPVLGNPTDHFGHLNYRPGDNGPYGIPKRHDFSGPAWKKEP